MAVSGRRSILKMMLAAGATGLSLAAGLLAPMRAIAAWPKAAFDAKTPKEVIDAIFKGGPIEKSSAVSIVAPDLAENGAIVPITVTAELSGIESITVLAEENPRPLASTYTLGKRAVLPFSMRIKLAKTQNVTAIVQAQGKLYTTTKRIIVSVGGCGG